jgi:hypothetical protein
MAEKISFEAPRGMRDFYPEDMVWRNRVFDAFRAAGAAYGFSPYDACVVESYELLARKAGEEVGEQIYHFLDKSERHLALRAEMTPTLARMVAQRQKELRLRYREPYPCVLVVHCISQGIARRYSCPLHQKSYFQIAQCHESRNSAIYVLSLQYNLQNHCSKYSTEEQPPQFPSVLRVVRFFLRITFLFRYHYPQFVQAIQRNYF